MKGNTGDGNWHYIEFHINSTIGVFDIWTEAGQVYHGTGLSISGPASWLQMYDNQDLPAQCMDYIDVDDIAISNTGYIGPVGSGTQYTITASAGSGGTISPSGTVSVYSGNNAVFTITPNTGYQIGDVLVDGTSVGPVSTYTFTNVIANGHTIAASFVVIPSYTITSSAGAGGTISPLGMTAPMYSGQTQTYTITPNANYSISSVLVDGGNVGTPTSITLTIASANRTISATFAPNAAPTYTLTPSPGANGTMNPSSAVTGVAQGSNYTFAIIPNSGYIVSNVTDNGTSVGAVTSYTITNIQADHTVAATFASNSSTILLTEHFDDDNSAGAWTSRGWDSCGGGSTMLHGVLDTSVKYAGAGSLRYDWAQGATKPTNGNAMYRAFTPTDSLYVSVYIMLQSGWLGSNTYYHPHLIYFLSDLDYAASACGALANNYLDTYMEIGGASGQASVYPRLNIQDGLNITCGSGLPMSSVPATESRAIAGCNGALGDTGTQAQSCYVAASCSSSPPPCCNGHVYWNGEIWTSATPFTTNAWHHYEMYLKMNTITGGIANADGIMQAWQDGVLTINKSNIVYRTGAQPTKKWEQVVLAPYIGVGSPSAQSMWFDELTVGTTPPAVSLGAPTIYLKQ